MNILQKIIFILIASLTVSCGGNKQLQYESINTENACAEKGGYWYNGKCWTEFDDDGIAAADIDKEVEKQMALIEKTKVNINGKSYPIDFFFPEQDGGQIILITIFEDENGAKTMLTIAKEKQFKGEKFDAEAMLLEGDLIAVSEDEAQMSRMTENPIATGKIQTTVYDFDEIDVAFKGILKGEKEYQIEYRVNESITGAGTSKVEVKGNEIHINGELGTRTYHQLKTTIANHPNAETVVLGQINGSLNDAVNMHTGRILHEAGLTTKVLKDSQIASGGVDLFCAGKDRIVEKGAKIGIHSWCCVNDLTAVELPKEHPAHKYQIAYFTMCMGEEIGPDFYFHTLTSAPFDGIHWMSDEDIKKWIVATKFLE